MQHTVESAIKLTGIGIHSGQEVNITILPAEPDSGVVFKRVDLGVNVVIPANYKYVHNTQACTILRNGDAAIATVEHLLSAFMGLGVDNAIVEVDGPEMPIMDGSSLEFAQAIQAVGLRTQTVMRKFLQVQGEVRVATEDKCLVIRPYNGLKISCAIDYDHPLFTKENMHCVFELNTDDYLELCAPARTYGFLKDYEYLLKNNLSRGASLDNVLVFGDDKVENPEGMRFTDECVRHKLLDLLGDLYLYGMPILGEIRAFKPGHALNAKLVNELAAIYDPSAQLTVS